MSTREQPVVGEDVVERGTQILRARGIAEPTEEQAAAAYAQAEAEIHATSAAKPDELPVVGDWQHARAEAILAEAGKLPGSYTEDEYVTAYARAERELDETRGAIARGEVRHVPGRGFVRSAA